MAAISDSPEGGSTGTASTGDPGAFLGKSVAAVAGAVGGGGSAESSAADILDEGRRQLLTAIFWAISPLCLFSGDAPTVRAEREDISLSS